jgi:acetyltransferase-like isoleucine patch superfamily enzyme
MARVDQALRSTLQRLEHEAALWRAEPLKRVAARNKLIRPLRVRRFFAFGPDSLIDRPVWLYGTRQMSVGAGVIILRGAWLAVERVAWSEPGPILDIRDGVALRVGCTISAAESVLIEEDVSMGAGATVIDSRHTWEGEYRNSLYNSVASAPVRVGRGTWVADRATVAAGSDIGEQCAIGPNSTVSGKVPDFSIVLGNPGRVVGSTRT